MDQKGSPITANRRFSSGKAIIEIGMGSERENVFSIAILRDPIEQHSQILILRLPGFIFVWFPVPMLRIKTLPDISRVIGCYGFLYEAHAPQPIFDRRYQRF